MKSAIVILALLAIAAPAAAQQRPDTTRMSCASARALVMQRGAVVLTTGPQTYDRFVVHRGYCTPSETTEPAFVRSADNPSCYVGDRCIERVLDDTR